MEDGDPITKAERGALFDSLSAYDVLLLAVSGGADSTAMMHLAARWHEETQLRQPELHICTVDHGLRPGAHREAALVAQQAKSLNLPHHLMRWQGEKPETGIQDAARQARYRLMADLLVSIAADKKAALITAHTQEDQAETVLMRLARGSGLDGLAAIRTVRRFGQDGCHDIVRPLLGVPKARLIATLRDQNIEWSEDPSNQRQEFERVKVRAAAPHLSKLGLTANKIALSAKRLQRAQSALDWAAARLEEDTLQLNGGAFAAIGRQQFGTAPEELRVRLLLRVLDAFGGAAPPARLSQVETLDARLQMNGVITMTLGGCIVAASTEEIHVYREPGRTVLPELALACGQPADWDCRFRVLVTAEDPGEAGAVSVRALGRQGYATLKQPKRAPLPAQIAASLPAFWSGQSLLAVPMWPDNLPAVPGFTFRADFIGLPDETRI